MTKPATDELIAMAEGMAELAKTGGASGYAVAGMFERLIARILQAEAENERLTQALLIGTENLNKALGLTPRLERLTAVFEQRNEMCRRLTRERDKARAALKGDKR